MVGSLQVYGLTDDKSHDDKRARPVGHRLGPLPHKLLGGQTRFVDASLGSLRSLAASSSRSYWLPHIALRRMSTALGSSRDRLGRIRLLL